MLARCGKWGQGEGCRVTMGPLRVTIGHLRVTIGHLRVIMGHLRLTIGHFRVTKGHHRITIGHYFFSISKHKANTIELHPKVRQTCILLEFLRSVTIFHYLMGRVSGRGGIEGRWEWYQGQ